MKISFLWTCPGALALFKASLVWWASSSSLILREYRISNIEIIYSFEMQKMKESLRYHVLELPQAVVPNQNHHLPRFEGYPYCARLRAFKAFFYVYIHCERASCGKTRERGDLACFYESKLDKAGELHLYQHPKYLGSRVQRCAYRKICSSQRLVGL